MAVDFSNAFGTVNHTLLLTDINNTNMDHNTIRWLTTYLRGRTATCKHNIQIQHHTHRQGSVLSPFLFNLYVSSFPQSNHTLTISYADDFTVSVTVGRTPEAVAALAAHATNVVQSGLLTGPCKSRHKKNLLSHSSAPKLGN